MRTVAYRILFLALILGAGCGAGDSQVHIAVRAAETEPSGGLEEMRFSGWGHTETFYLHDEVLLTEREIASASVTHWDGRPAVEVLLTDSGRETFADVTARHIGKRLAVVVDGRLACVPVVRDTIRQGKILINGDFSEDEVRQLAEGLARR